MKQSLTAPQEGAHNTFHGCHFGWHQDRPGSTRITVTVHEGFLEWLEHGRRRDSRGGSFTAESRSFAAYRALFLVVTASPRKENPTKQQSTWWYGLGLGKEQLIRLRQAVYDGSRRPAAPSPPFRHHPERRRLLSCGPTFFFSSISDFRNSPATSESPFRPPSSAKSLAPWFVWRASTGGLHPGAEGWAGKAPSPISFGVI